MHHQRLFHRNQAREVVLVLRSRVPPSEWVTDCSERQVRASELPPCRPGRENSHGSGMRTVRSSLVAWLLVGGIAGLAPIAAAAAVSSAIDTTPRQIIAGVKVGPVALGMSAAEAVRVALKFQQATRCQIDLLIVDGRVAAAGTRFGACLQVSLPKPQIVGWAGFPPILPDPIVGGPASAFITAFGNPLKIALAANSMALMWSQGMVVHVSGCAVGQAIVTYVAVVVPGSRGLPAIGHFRAGPDS